MAETTEVTLASDTSEIQSAFKVYEDGATAEGTASKVVVEMEQQKKDAMKALRTMFDSIDADNNGYVDKSELTEALKLDKKGLSNILAAVRIDVNWFVFEQLDANDDGKLTWEEFSNAVGPLTVAEVDFRLKAIGTRDYDELEGSPLLQVLEELSELLRKLEPDDCAVSPAAAQERAKDWAKTLGQQGIHHLSSLAQLQPSEYSQLDLILAVSSKLRTIVEARKAHEQEKKARVEAKVKRGKKEAAVRKVEEVAAAKKAKNEAKAKEAEPNPNLEEFRKVHATIPIKRVKEALVRAEVAVAVYEDKSEEEIKQIEEEAKQRAEGKPEPELRKELRDNIKGGLDDTELKEMMPDTLTDIEECRKRTTLRLLQAAAVDYKKWDEKPTDAIRRIRDMLRDCTKEEMKNALRAPSMDRHRFYWFSHVISVGSIEQEKCLIDLRGHFKFFWRVPTAVWDAKMRDGSIKFTTWKGHEQMTCDENGGKNWFQIEDNGKEHGNIFPINPTMPFETSVKIETDNGWWSIHKKTKPDFPGEPAMSLIQMQLDSTVTLTHTFDASRYPYDKQAVLLRHNERKFPDKEFNKTVQKAAGEIELKPLTNGKWHPFSSSPSKISGYRDKKAYDNWDQLYFSFPGYSTFDGMEWHTATQLPVQDKPVPSASMADLSQLKTQIYPNAIPEAALKSKKEKWLRKRLAALSEWPCMPFSVPSKTIKDNEGAHRPFICIRLQRNPTHFFYQVVVPMWIIVNASMTSFMVDEMNDEEPASFADKVQISLTSLLTIIGMYQVVNEMRPHYDGLTRADTFMLVGTAITGFVVLENVIVSYRQDQFDVDINAPFLNGMRAYQVIFAVVWNMINITICCDKIWAALSDDIANGVKNRSPTDSSSYTPSRIMIAIKVARTWEMAIQRQLRILQSADDNTPSTTLEYKDNSEDEPKWQFTGDQLDVDVAEDGYPIVQSKQKPASLIRAFGRAVLSRTRRASSIGTSGTDQSPAAAVAAI